MRQLNIAWSFQNKGIVIHGAGSMKEKQEEEVPHVLDGSPSDKVMCAIRTEGMKKTTVCSKEQIRKAQEEDDECQRIRSETTSASIISWDQLGIKLYIGADNLIYAKGNIQLSRGEGVAVDVVYVPKAIRNKVLEMEHNSSWATHPQYLQLCKAVVSHYFWPTFRSDIRKFTESCVACQKNREKRKRTVILDFDKPCVPWDTVAVDIIGPIFKSSGGNEYILSVVDIFTRFITLVPIRDQTKETILKALETKYLARFGCPRIILSDNGSNFCSSLFEEVCSILGIVHRRTPPYHPQGNGTLERSNREVKKKLTFLCANSSHSWDEKIHMVEFAINNSHNTSIGTSPSELLYGRRMRSPASTPDLLEDENYISTSPYIDGFRDRLAIIRKTAEQWDKSSRRKRNNYKNLSRNLPKYEVGEEILYKRIRNRGNHQEGFTFGYVGPYVIKDKVSEVTYRVENPEEPTGRIITAHADRIKKFMRTRCDKEGSGVEQGKRQGIMEEPLNNVHLEESNDTRTGESENDSLPEGEIPETASVSNSAQLAPSVEEDTTDNVIQENHIAVSLDEENVHSEPIENVNEVGNKESVSEPLSELLIEGRITGKQGEESNKVNHPHFTRSKGKIKDFDYNNYEFDRGGNVKYKNAKK